MKFGSKVAIYKCEKCKADNGEYYKATVIESAYNPKKKLCGKYDYVQHKVYIMDTTYELEPADFSLGVDKEKYSFRNIANPDKSIYQVIDFEDKKNYVWDKSGFHIQKDDYGQPKTKTVFYIRKLLANNEKYVAPEKELVQLREKLQEEKEKTKLLRKQISERVKVRADRMKDTLKANYSKQISDLKTEIRVLTVANKRLKQFNLRKENEVCAVQNKVKTSNLKLGYTKRMNVQLTKEVKALRKELDKQDKKILDIKKMKKQEIIKQAKEDCLFFDDI